MNTNRYTVGTEYPDSDGTVSLDMSRLNIPSEYSEKEAKQRVAAINALGIRQGSGKRGVMYLLPRPIDGEVHRYLLLKGQRCLFCGSGKLKDTGEAETDAGYHTRKVACNDCGKSWKDLYKLSSVETL